MRRFITVFILSFFMTAAVLADVIIDGQIIRSDLLETIEIDPDSGDITIESNVDTFIRIGVIHLSSNVRVDLSVIPPTVPINDTATVIWEVFNATFCEAFDGLDTWGGEVDSTNGTHTMDINSGPDPLEAEFTIACDDGGTPVVANAMLTVTADPAVIINSFTVTPSVIETGSSVAVAWNVSNATSCNASGNVPDWDGPVDAVADGLNVTINTAGSYTFTLTCNNATNMVSENEFVTVTDPADPAVVIHSFTVTPSVIETGSSVAVAWNVSNATSCNASGNVPDWDGPVDAVAGNDSVTINIAGSYTFTLTCNNATNMVSENEFVTVTDPVTNCTPPTLNGTVRSWTDEFLGAVWPLPTFTQKIFAVTPRAGYTALEFNTGNFLATGGIVTAAVTANSGTRFGSISPCPGDFTSVPSNCIKDWGPGSSLNWSTFANPPSNTCKLDANTRYYFNLTFTDGVSSATDTCQIFGFGTTCFTTLRVFSEQ